MRRQVLDGQQGLSLGADEQAEVVALDRQLDGLVVDPGGAHLAADGEGHQQALEELVHELGLFLNGGHRFVHGAAFLVGVADGVGGATGRRAGGVGLRSR